MRELRSAPALVTPALVLVAAAAIAEGYGWLGLLRLSGREPSAVAFAAFVLVFTFVLTRRRGAYRVAGADFLVGSALFLLVATLSSLLFGGPAVAGVVGVSAFVFAAGALGAAVVDEHRSRWRGDRKDRVSRGKRRPQVAAPTSRNVLQ